MEFKDELKKYTVASLENYQGTTLQTEEATKIVSDCSFVFSFLDMMCLIL